MNKKLEKFLILSTVLIISPLSGSGIDIYTPSLPHLQNYFLTTSTGIKLTISFYLYGLCLGQLIMGTLSDYHGRKPFNLAGCIGFILTSYGITHTNQFHLLLALRLLQGFSVGALAANARSMITDTFTKQESIHVTPMMSLSWSLGPILAPFLGGLFQHYLDWKVSFYFLACYATLVLALATWIPETNQMKSRINLSVLFQRYTYILFHRTFIQALLLMALGYSILMYYATILPYFIQNIFQKSALFYGNTTTLIGLSYLIGAIVNRQLNKHLKPEAIINLALLAMITLSAGMLALLATHSITIIYILLSLLTVCIGMMFPSCLFKCVSTFPQDAGKASALAGGFFILVGATSSAIFSHLTVLNTQSLLIPILVMVGLSLVTRLFLSWKNII